MCLGTTETCQVKVVPEVGKWILGSKEKCSTTIVPANKENTVHLELP